MSKTIALESVEAIAPESSNASMPETKRAATVDGNGAFEGGEVTLVGGGEPSSKPPPCEAETSRSAGNEGCADARARAPLGAISREWNKPSGIFDPPHPDQDRHGLLDESERARDMAMGFPGCGSPPTLCEASEEQPRSSLSESRRGLGVTMRINFCVDIIDKCIHVKNGGLRVGSMELL